MDERIAGVLQTKLIGLKQEIDFYEKCKSEHEKNALKAEEALGKTKEEHDILLKFIMDHRKE